jgi:hypothetical protein
MRMAALLAAFAFVLRARVGLDKIATPEVAWLGVPMRQMIALLLTAACLACAGCSGLGCNSAGDGKQQAGLCGLHGTFLGPRAQGGPVSGR